MPSLTTASQAFGMTTVGSTNLIAGCHFDENGRMGPILWSYTGSGNSTHVAFALPTGMTEGVALGVNDVRDVVGSAWSAGDMSDEVACVWPQGGSVQVLNSISGDGNWNLIRARKINSSSSGRKIVGFGVHTVGGVGLNRGFVLSSWY